MHSKLREREVDAFFIKCCINRLIDAKINFPIIRTFHPYTDNNIHTAVCQRMQGNERSRISQNTRVTGNNRFDHRLYFIIILTIIDTECPIYSAGTCRLKFVTAPLLSEPFGIYTILLSVLPRSYEKSGFPSPYRPYLALQYSHRL